MYASRASTVARLSRAMTGGHEFAPRSRECLPHWGTGCGRAGALDWLRCDCARDRARADGRASLEARRSRRRDDASPASCSPRSTPDRSRSSPRALPARLCARLRDERKDDDELDAGGHPRSPAAARTQRRGGEPGLRCGVGPTRGRGRRARGARGRRGGVSCDRRQVRPRTVFSATSSATSSTATASWS